MAAPNLKTATNYNTAIVDARTSTPSQGGTLSFTISPDALYQPVPGLFVVSRNPDVSITYTVTVTESGNPTTAYLPPVTVDPPAKSASKVRVLQKLGGTFTSNLDTPAVVTPTPVVVTPTPTSGDLLGVLSVSINTALATVKLPKVPHFTVELTTTGTNLDGLLVDLEASQAGVKKGQAYVTGKSVRRGSTTYVEIDMPGLVDGTYDLSVLIFNDPAPGTYAFGTKRFEAANIKKFTLSPADVYVPTAANPTGFYRAPQQVSQYVGSYPELAVIADQPQGVWLGNEWIPDVKTTATNLRTAAAGAPLLLVIYSIPGRDAGQYSAGGLSGPTAYKAWIDQLALGVANAPVSYVLEPDALGLIGSLDSVKRAERIDMLKYAVGKLRGNPNAKVYLDASLWIGTSDMASRLQECNPGGSTGLTGFSLNVSGYHSNSECLSYAAAVSSASGVNLKYVIDTSRNGRATAGSEWCNPSGQGLGKKPTLNTGVTNADAFLWIKSPGESDGTCNGGPAAGAFWLERARELIANAVFA